MNIFNKIFNWFADHDIQISWFLIGYTTSITTISIERGDWAVAAINAVILVALITAERLGVRTR
jgi:hypothetical protein